MFIMPNGLLGRSPCVATNLYWYFHKDIYPELFIKINITIALLLIMVVLYQRFSRDIKNEQQKKYFI
jgi:hypothetical protein